MRSASSVAYRVKSCIWSDDTTLKVVEAQRSKCHMWVYGCGGDSPVPGQPPGIVLYDYQDSREETCPVEFLRGYEGYLQADGYAGNGRGCGLSGACPS